MDWLHVVPLFLLSLCIILIQSRFLTAFPGGLADPRFNSVILEHVYRWLLGLEPSLWSPRFFYPFPDILAFSDNHFGSIPVYAVLRLMGLDRYDAYTGWFTFSAVPNFIACAWLLRRLGFSGLSSGAGALLYTAALPVTGQIWHAQLNYRFAAPLALLALHRLFQRQDLTQLAWLAFWGAWQFFCTIYIGFFLVFLVIAWIVGLYVVRPRNPGEAYPHNALWQAMRVASAWQRAGVALVVLVALAGLGAMLGVYHRVADVYGFARDYREVANMLPRPTSYLTADHSFLWQGTTALLPRPPLPWEHRLFAGVGASMLAIIGVLGNRSRVVRVALVAVAILVVLTLYIGGFSFYRLLFPLPGFDAIRAVSRIWFVMALPVSIFVAAGTQYLTGGRLGLGPQASLKGPILLALMVVESALILPDHVSRSELEASIAQVSSLVPSDLPPDAILFVRHTPKQASVISELNTMIVAQERGIATLDGYSGNSPPGFDGEQKAGCATGADQLAAYVRFAHLDAAAFDALKQRVVAIGFPGCEPNSWRMP